MLGGDCYANNPAITSQHQLPPAGLKSLNSNKGVVIRRKEMLIEESRVFGDAEEICDFDAIKRHNNRNAVLNSLSSVGEQPEHEVIIFNQGNQIHIAINDSTLEDNYSKPVFSTNVQEAGTTSQTRLQAFAPITINNSMGDAMNMLQWEKPELKEAPDLRIILGSNNNRD